MRKVWGGVLVFTGLIACPCHLPLTLALLAGVLGGAGLGSVVADHQGVIYGIATGYFVASIAAGWYLLSRKRGAKEARNTNGKAQLASARWGTQR